MQTGSSTTTQLGFGLSGYPTGGVLIGAYVIGQFTSTLFLGIQILRNYVSLFRKNITMKGMITALKRYSNFPKYSIFAVLLNNFSFVLPVFVLTVYFNPGIVGLYSLGLMVLTAPLSLIQNAISQVFFQRAAEVKNTSPQKLKEVVGQTIKPLIFLAFLMVIIFILIGPELFSVIFGARWEEAGNYVRFLSLWVGLGLVASPISYLFTIFEKQRFTAILTIIELILPLVAIIIGAQTGSALNAIILFGIVSFITKIYGYFYLLRLADISFLVPSKIVLNFSLLSIPFVLSVLVFQKLFSPYNLLIVCFSLLIFLIFSILIIKRDREISDLFKSITATIPIINNIAKYLY